MFRLIWAELKKILLNIKLMITLIIVLLAFIFLFTMIYNSIKNAVNYPEYNPGNDYNYDKETGGPQEYDANFYIELINTYKSEIGTNLALIADVKGGANKQLITQNVNNIKTSKAAYDTAVDALSDIELPSAENITRAEAAKFFDESGEHYAKLNEIVTIYEEIKTDITNISALSDYLYFEKEFLFPINGYNDFVYLSFLMQNMYELENFVTQYNDIKNYFVSISEADWDNPSNENEYIISYIKDFLNNNLSLLISDGSGYLNFTNNKLDDFIAAIDEEGKIMEISESVYNKINNFINDNGIKRLDAYIEKIQTLDAGELTQKEKDAQFEQIITYAQNMNNALNLYINDTVRYEYIKGFSDNYLQNYVSLNGEYLSELPKYQIRKNLTLTDYIVEKNLDIKRIDYTGNIIVEGYASPATPLSLNTLFLMSVFTNIDNFNMYAYIGFVLSFLSIVIIIINISLGGGSIAGEQTRGTIKMLIIRPYKRWKILTAKIISNLIFSLGLIILSLIVLFVFGAAFFGYGLSSLPVLAVFNASKVVIFNPFAELLINICFMIVSLIIYTLISTLFSVVFKSRTFAVVVALLLNMLGSILSIPLSNFTVFKYFIFNNTDLYMYWGNGPSLLDMSFGFSVTVNLIYAAIFSFLAYFAFIKRDLN